jgi:hypothetical protein
MSKKPRIEEYHEPVGGWGDALATETIVREQGVFLKSGAAPFFMNTPDGFNCPSCAWPDSPPHSDPLVCCEIDAKVLTSESTKKRARPLLSRLMTVRLQNDEPRVLGINFIEGHTARFETVRNNLRHSVAQN